METQRLAQILEIKKKLIYDFLIEILDIKVPYFDVTL
jgi:hypothetical protein